MKTNSAMFILLYKVLISLKYPGKKEMTERWRKSKVYSTAKSKSQGDIINKNKRYAIIKFPGGLKEFEKRAKDLNYL